MRERVQERERKGSQKNYERGSDERVRMIGREKEKERDRKTERKKRTETDRSRLFEVFFFCSFQEM